MNITEFISNNWGELTLAAMAFAKIVVNLLPTEHPAHNVFEMLDRVITAITGDRRKGKNELPDDFDLQ